MGDQNYSRTNPTRPHEHTKTIPLLYPLTTNKMNSTTQTRSRAYTCPTTDREYEMIQSCIDLSVSILRAHTKGQGKKVSKLRKECERQLDMLESLPNAYIT